MSDKRNLKIVIVDDRAADRELVREALVSDDYTADIIAADGLAALAPILEGPPADVVLTDFDLGCGDGLEVLNLVRSKWPDTPVMFVTGTGSEEIAIAAMRRGVADYVLKTADLSELLPLRLLAVLRQADALTERAHALLWRGAVLDALPARIALVGADGTIMHTNARWDDYHDPALRAACGAGQNYFEVCNRAAAAGDPDAALVAHKLREVLAGRSAEFTHEYACTEPERPEAWYRMLVSRTDSRGDGGAVVAHFDETLRHTMQTRLDFLANHDTLTGLPNRAGLQQRANEAIGRAHLDGTHLALLVIDLDAFKTINDSLGIRAGDEVLQIVTATLKSTLRDGAVLARLNGDEFAVLVEGLASPEAATPIAGQIIENLRRPIHVNGQEIVLSAGIGIACHPGDGSTADDLLRCADSALHEAKGDGAGAVRYFASGMNAQALENLRLQVDLRHAIADGQLTVQYQPVVSLPEGQIMGAEALVRWSHPELGMIPPLRFIPIAEETGLILPLGEFVLREAVSRAADWRRRGLLGYVAVNLSMRQFRDAELAEMIQKALAEFRCPPSALRIELTESMLSASPELARQVLEKLHAIGVTIAIDDFGTGYSSLSYLKLFPLDVLKIDRSFVKDTPEDKDDVAIVRAVIALAQSLGLLVIAEGVETEAQSSLLTAEGCDAAQGYRFSMPLPARDLEWLLRSKTTLPIAEQKLAVSA
ncbi:MAG: EAL domain-containing protein [Xanthomonadaceae bacterium]|nr:EAL domain-containing protein [Xanthomonadaceae bacterium]